MPTPPSDSTRSSRRELSRRTDQATPPCIGRPPSSGASSSLLDDNEYERPAGNIALSTTSATLVQMDANAEVSFVAPASGEFGAVVSDIGSRASGGYSSWGLVDTAGAAVADSLAEYMTNATVISRLTYSKGIVGLTPGDTSTWRPAYATGGTGTAQVFVGPDRHLRTEVWAA